MTDVLKELKREIEAICKDDELPPRAVKILQWIAEQALTQDGVIDEGELYSQLVRLGECINALIIEQEGEQ